MIRRSLLGALAILFFPTWGLALPAMPHHLHPHPHHHHHHPHTHDPAEIAELEAFAASHGTVAPSFLWPERKSAYQNRVNQTVSGLPNTDLPFPFLSTNEENPSNIGSIPTGPEPFLVVLVEFADQSLTFSDAAWQDQIFGSNNSVDSFFRVSSNDQFFLIPAQENIGTPNDGIARVSLPTNHPDGINNQAAIHQALRDSLDLLAQNMDFAQFDTNGSGQIGVNELHVAFFFAGREQSQGCGGTPCVWGHRSRFNGNGYSVDGVDLFGQSFGGGYMVMGERHAGNIMATIGIVIHELGHDLGLPDLYNTANRDVGPGMDDWTVMASGSWGRVGGAPAGSAPTDFDAWSKFYLGWEDPLTLSTTQLDVPMEDVRGETGLMLLLPVPDHDADFLLVERRDRILNDLAMPSPAGGILTWLINVDLTDPLVIDSNATNARNVASDPYGVSIVEVDGNRDLWTQSGRAEASDIMPIGGEGVGFLPEYNDIVLTDNSTADVAIVLSGDETVNQQTSEVDIIYGSAVHDLIVNEVQTFGVVIASRDNPIPVVVGNLNGFPSPEFDVALFYSTDRFLSPGDIELGRSSGSEASALEPQSVLVDADGTLLSVGDEGFLLGVVDPDDVIDERDELNNTTFVEGTNAIPIVVSEPDSPELYRNDEIFYSVDTLTAGVENRHVFSINVEGGTEGVILENLPIQLTRQGLNSRIVQVTAFLDTDEDFILSGGDQLIGGFNNVDNVSALSFTIPFRDAEDSTLPFTVDPAETKTLVIVADITPRTPGTVPRILTGAWPLWLGLSVAMLGLGVVLWRKRRTWMVALVMTLGLGLGTFGMSCVSEQLDFLDPAYEMLEFSIPEGSVTATSYVGQQLLLPNDVPIVSHNFVLNYPGL